MTKRPTPAYVRLFCRPGKSLETCRYLCADGRGFICAKHDAFVKEQIERRYQAGTMSAKGDNCEGLK